MYQEALSVTTSDAVVAINSAAVTTSAAAATSAAVTTSAAVASAAPINIITDEVIRPAYATEGSILRGLLTKDTRDTTTGDLKINLLEGLGDDFLNEPPLDEQALALLIDEITPAVDQNATITALHEGPSQAPPSSISAPETLSSSGTEDEDKVPSPVSGVKRKNVGGGGKGAKIFKPSIEEESSHHLSSQPEHKVLMQYQNLIAQVEEQKRLYEERKRESQERLTFLSSRREEVENRQKKNKLLLENLLDKLKELQETINNQRTKCREDEDELMSLLRDETQIITEQESYHEKLFSLQRRLLALRLATGDK